MKFTKEAQNERPILGTQTFFGCLEPPNETTEPTPKQ